jgi:hypothetical protein
MQRYREDVSRALFHLGAANESANSGDQAKEAASFLETLRVLPQTTLKLCIMIEKGRTA